MRRLWFEKPQGEHMTLIFRASLALLLIGVIFGIVYFSTGPYAVRVYEGDISFKDVYAPYDFTYTGDIDEEKMKEAEAEALKGIHIIYEINTQISERFTSGLKAIFDKVRETQRMGGTVSEEDKVKNMQGLRDFTLSLETALSLIRQPDVDKVELAIAETAKIFIEKGILSAIDKESLRAEGIAAVAVINPKDSSEKVADVSSILTLDELWSDAGSSMAQAFPNNKEIRDASVEIMKILLSSNLLSSNDLTEKRTREALDKLPRTYKIVSVKKDEILISRGEKITKAHTKMLRQLGELHDIGGRLFYVIGILCLLVIFLLIAIVHLKFYESKIFKDNRNLILISISAIFIISTAQAIINSPLSSYLIPLASASMVIAILLDAHSAFIFTVIMSIFIGVISGNNYGLMVVMFVGSSVGIYSVRKVRRRSKLLLAGIFIGVANFFAITTVNLLNDVEPLLFLSEGGLGLLSGIASFFLCFGFLPILEYAFKILTDITLLEISDLNHPVLKEMATKAPGTYHHSLIVGNLAENASDAIGANSLLARVGAYYHDIGKIEKAEYFSENESEPKHDHLAPSMSALIITNHVKDGADLARKFKLNQVIIDFIQQHHGNGLIYFFYQRALEKTEDEQEIKEEAFRYPGPRPQTKETAIVLLADSVEASSRTLANPTPSRVQGLVQRIVNNKFIDGQLDECDLTLLDLHRISEAFVRILNAMFHTRVEYPDEDEKKTVRGGKNHGKKPDQRQDTRGPLDKKDGKENLRA